MSSSGSIIIQVSFGKDLRCSFFVIFQADEVHLEVDGDWRMKVTWKVDVFWTQRLLISLTLSGEIRDNTGSWLVVGHFQWGF